MDPAIYDANKKMDKKTSEEKKSNKEVKILDPAPSGFHGVSQFLRIILKSGPVRVFSEIWCDLLILSIFT